jgi:hypothetical protein
LIPDRERVFVIICDPWFPPGNEMRIPFRIAHELAHTLFYDWDERPPPMMGSAGSSRAAEAFCDEFAQALLSEQMKPHLRSRRRLTDLERFPRPSES